MNGDADIPHRSSSPLKRRASSMDPEVDPSDTNTSKGETSQAADTLPRAMSIDPPDTNGAGPANGSQAVEPPSIQEQVKVIETLLKASKDSPLKQGDKAYLVSRTWVDKALALRTELKRAKETDEIEPLGPVDNSDITDAILEDSTGQEFIRLKPGLGLESFELFTEDAWNLVAAWYGLSEGQKPIIRTVINQAPDDYSEPEYIYELHPPVFRVHRLWSEVSPLPIDSNLKARNPPPLTLVRSRKAHAQTFLKDAKRLSDIPYERKVRIFAIPQPQPTGEVSKPRSAFTPPDSPSRSDGDAPNHRWTHLLLDTPSFSEVRDSKLMVPLADNTGNQNYNGSSTLQMIHELVTDQTLVLDEQVEDQWVSTYRGTSKKQGKVLSMRDNASALSSKTNSGRNSPAPQGPVTRGRGQKNRLGRSLGAVGLQNLGNTCYMNSALQCVRSVEELTKYFLTDSYNGEINKSNPLGYHGKVAMAYVGLLREIYDEGRGSVSPRDFKNTVGRCRSTFQGWGQQDSQEFLGFLLDGLQEDLSRIKNKPYIEKPDSTDDMINDPEAIRKMAEEVWDITRRRDDSVIADLFTGMYKSTLKCPVCAKISITFDPFNNLTLPLPVEDMWVKPVKFFPLNDAPVKIEVELSKHSAIEQLKQFISDRTGVPTERLMGAEEFKDRFFKIYDNTQDISEEIQSSDIPTIHEVESAPTNWPSSAPRKKYRSMLDIDTPPDAAEWDDPKYERMVVPVFHRRPNVTGRGADNTSPPHFIILTKEEASNYDRIQRKVLEKVSTFTTWSKLTEEDGSDSTNNVDSDGVVVAASDADSSGDSKITTHSVKGEEDMVDVTMKDGPENAVSQSSPSQTQQSKVLKRFNTKRPAFIRSDTFLDPELQNLFDLSYFTDASDGSVPTGWSQVENSRTLPKLTDRMPQSSVEDDQASHESWGSTASGNDDSSNEEAPKLDPEQARVFDQSSEEDESSAARFARRPAQRGGHGGRKKHKTYGKKGNKRRERQGRGHKEQRAAAIKPQPMPPAVADGGPLIRLGEGLVVDWHEEAWDVVFGKSSFGRDSTDTRTFMDLETLHDPALKITQRRRQHRRSRGITLDECLDEFERAEVLSEQDMWYCPRCKEHRRASKKFDLWKSPDILVAHLKRFSSSGYRRDKLDVLVDFPIEGLDLTERVIEKEDGRAEVYDLIAVDDHYGGLGGGHYTAYAKNFMDGQWYNYNDSSVSKVADPSSAVTSAAYLLFYRRRSTTPLGGARFTEIFEKFDNPHEDNDSATGSGDDQRQGGGGFYQNGLSNGGTGAAATRLQAGRGSAKTTVTPLTDPDEDEPPAYSSRDGGSTVQLSIEDEGVEMSDTYQSLNSNPMAQGWSFTSLTDNAVDGSTGAGFASDDAQANSTDDEQHQGKEPYDQDVEMASALADVDSDMEAPPAPDDNAQIALSDIQNEAWQRRGVISVPAKEGSDRDSDVVAEIHVEGDKGARND